MSNLVEKLLLEHLLKLQNRDGGWGAARGRQSNPEATAYALMALVDRQDRIDLRSHMLAAVTWLLDVQDSSGAWFYAKQVKQGAWVTAPVILALLPFEPHLRQVLRGAEWLLQQKGERLGVVRSLLYSLSKKRRTVDMDPNLQGWSWASHTTSWVEPTALGLITLNKLRPVLSAQITNERIQQGEALLYDRMCVEGGWNYGNSVVLNERLLPYPDTTAMSLIALQAYQDKPENQMSLRVLNEMIERQRSGLTLSWAIICRFVYGQHNALLKTQLLEQYEIMSYVGQTKPMALSLLAMGDPSVFFQV